jgi:hypothetical protein
LGREGWLKNGCPLVRDRFVKNGERLYNVRLLEEREKQKMWREKSAAGGRKSGKVRRKSKKTELLNTTKGGSVLVRTKREPNHEPNTNSSSSSSSSNIPPIIPPFAGDVSVVNGQPVFGPDFDFSAKAALEAIFVSIRTAHPKGRNKRPTEAQRQFFRKVKRITQAEAMKLYHDHECKIWEAGTGCPDLWRWIRDFDFAAELPEPPIRQNVNPNRRLSTAELNDAWAAKQLEGS